VGTEEHHAAADDLDRVADQHDPALGHRVGKGADKGGEDDVGNGEERLEQRFVFGRRLHLAQGGDGGNEQGVVGKRRKELRGHDDIEAERHEKFVSYITLGEVYTTLRNRRKACAVRGLVHVPGGAARKGTVGCRSYRLMTGRQLAHGFFSRRAGRVSRKDGGM